VGRLRFKVTTLGNAVDQFARFVSKIGLLLVLYFGATEVMEGRLTVGQLVAFNMLAAQLSEPILKLVNVWSQFQQARVSIARVGDILNNRPEAEAGDRLVAAPPLMGAISFRETTFRYRPELPDAVAGVSFDVAAGEVIGIVGTSGSGKSTLTRLVQGLHHPTSGRVMIDELDVKMLEPRSIRRQIGVVLQENVLFNATVAQNIAFGRPETEVHEIVDAARLAGAHEFIVELPQGYNTMIGERGTSLSGGQRQRVAIARALVSNPPILIFDEATSALDYETEARIQENMALITMGRTVIVIAHRLSTVRNANRILVMERGRVIESGTHEELLKTGGRYAALHAIQAG
jgi:subfamily B ATP-binding cassette protein HlyB/CyaB